MPSLTTTGRRAADRDVIGERRRNYSNKWTPLTLRNPRDWETLVHPSDISETNQAASIRNITKTFNETQKFPEMDKYVSCTVYNDRKSLGLVPISAKLTTENVLLYIDAMSEEMTERNVPASGRILYVTPRVNTIIKNAKDFYRTINVQNSSERIQRAIGILDELQIEVVPSELMLTSYDFTEGAVRGKSAKQIQMFMVHPTAIITPVTYAFAKLDPPSAGSQGKWDYYEESEEDVFILPNKEDGVDFLIEEIPIADATITVAASTAAEAVTGDCTITVTSPIGTNLLVGSRYFYKVYESSSTAPTKPTYGEIISTDDGWVEWDGVSDANITNGKKIMFVVTDRKARAYAAVNSDVTSKA